MTKSDLKSEAGVRTEVNIKVIIKVKVENKVESKVNVKVNVDRVGRGAFLGQWRIRRHAQAIGQGQLRHT